jgi:hypothetical protein
VSEPFDAVNCKKATSLKEKLFKKHIKQQLILREPKNTISGALGKYA